MAQDTKERRVAYLKRAVALEMANIRWERSKKNALEALDLLGSIGIPLDMLVPIAKKVGDKLKNKNSTS